LVDYLDRVVIKKKPPPPQDKSDSSKKASKRNEKLENSKDSLFSSNDLRGQ
jgi:hypothetical protein